jgi:hypothetical protein
LAGQIQGEVKRNEREEEDPPFILGEIEMVLNPEHRALSFPRQPRNSLTRNVSQTANGTTAHYGLDCVDFPEILNDRKVN